MSNQLTQKIDFFNQSFNSDKENLNCIILNLAENASNTLNLFNETQKKGKLFGKTLVTHADKIPF